MKFPGFPTTLCVLAFAAPTSAREVDLLQFANAQSVESESKSTFDTRGTGEAVSTSLREHFAERAEEQTHRGNARILPSRKSRGATNDVGLNLPPQRSTATALACDGASYTPTWWLAPAAETRRSLYFETVARIACEQGLPTRLLDAMIAQESGYNSRAISSAGAMGMMQIMPDTARSLGLARPFDPVANMRAGARYLREQLDRFGRVDLALAAYNAGPERRSLRLGRIPAIAETIGYVRAITGNWARLAALEQRATRSHEHARTAHPGVNAPHYRSVEHIGFNESGFRAD